MIETILKTVEAEAGMPKTSFRVQNAHRHRRERDEQNKRKHYLRHRHGRARLFRAKIRKRAIEIR